MTLFRKKLHEPQFPDPATGGIDPVLWRLLVRGVTAVSTDDPERFLKTIRVIADRQPLSSTRLFGYYVYFMLKNSLTALVGATPQRSDLGEVARRIQLRFLRFIPDGANELLPVLLTPFNLETDEEQVTGARYTLCALGLGSVNSNAPSRCSTLGVPAAQQPSVVYARRHPNPPENVLSSRREPDASRP